MAVLDCVARVLNLMLLCVLCRVLADSMTTEMYRRQDPETEAPVPADNVTEDAMANSTDSGNSTDHEATTEGGGGDTTIIELCSCFTRGPLTPFKLHGNLHFPFIEFNRPTSTARPASTCPPCFNSLQDIFDAVVKNKIA